MPMSGPSLSRRWPVRSVLPRKGRKGNETKLLKLAICGQHLWSPSVVAICARRLRSSSALAICARRLR